MYFVQDPESNFYYYGEQEPTGKTYKELLVDSPPKLIGVDVETISLKERIAIGVGISVNPTTSFYFQLFPTVSPATPWHLLRDPTVTKVFHNALFDLSALREYDIDNGNIWDTNVMARLLCYKYSGLLDLSFVHKMEVHDAKEILKEHNAGTTLGVPQAVMARKCMQDSGATLKLFYELYEDVNIPYLKTEMALIPILIEMSNRGLLIDQEARQELEDTLSGEVDYYLNICNDIGFNPGSPQQVAYILAKRGAYSMFHRLPFTKGSGKKNLSSAAEILEKMDDPIASLVLTYRKVSKLLNTYIIPWKHEDRATTRFHLDAITGRPSSTDRNMQNIPKGKPRGIFVPDSGVWTDMDFSQVELRILANLSQDKEMLHIYSLPPLLPDGSKNIEADIHQATANFLGIERRFAKNVNFAMIYGATDQTIAETAHIRSIDRAHQLKESWFKLYTGAGDWISAVQHEATNTYRARTIFGRNLRLPTLDEERLDGIQRKAVNYPIQGSAAEILKRGLIICKDLPMALQVHDEILVDGFTPDYKFKPLEDIAPFHTPVEVKYLERWE